MFAERHLPPSLHENMLRLMEQRMKSPPGTAFKLSDLQSRLTEADLLPLSLKPLEHKRLRKGLGWIEDTNSEKVASATASSPTTPASAATSSSSVSSTDPVTSSTSSAGSTSNPSAGMGGASTLAPASAAAVASSKKVAGTVVVEAL